MKELFVIWLLGVSLGLNAQGSLFDHEKHFVEIQQSGLLILGTFHFKDTGLDGYKPAFDIDILSTKRQTELEYIKIKPFIRQKRIHFFQDTFLSSIS